MPRFIYSAHGIAIAGRITRPINYDLEPKGVCILPPCGGKVVSKDGPFSLSDPATGNLLLSYSSAETSIEGSESSKGINTTVFVSTVRELNVGNVLRCGEITAKLMLTYHDGDDRVDIDTDGSGFFDLTICGKPFPVEVDNDMARKASDYDKFRKDHKEFKQKLNKITWVLGRNKDLTPDEDGEPHKRQPDFGRIYFAEWQAGAGTQKLTMLRLKLGSPQAADIDIGSGGSNGQTYP
jgi:hypothetical protein